MSNHSTVSEIIARPTRTLIQATPAVVFTEFWDSFVTDLTEKQYGAAVGLLTLVFAALQALIENWTGKGLLRHVPPKDVPVTDTIAGPVDPGPNP